MWTHSLQNLQYAHKFSLIKLSNTCKVVDINSVCVWDHFLSSSPTVWVCFLWKAPLAGLKPEHFRLLSADSSDGSAGNMLSSFPMQHIHDHEGTWQDRERVSSLEEFKSENIRLQYTDCYQIANIYLENKTSCRQLLISSVIMGKGTDQWLKCQIKMACVCVTSLNHLS